nr:hypothetical protein [Tanacetum cinerariifolium]
LLTTLRAVFETPDAHAQNMEESNKCTWSSKCQELEATGIMWCADHNLYNHTADFVSGKKVPTLKIYSRPDAECFGTHDDEAGSSQPKRTRQSETVKEAMLPHVHHEFLLQGTSNRAAKTRYSTNFAWLLPRQIYLPYVVYWGLLNNMGCAEEIEDMLEIKVYEIG